MAITVTVLILDSITFRGPLLHQCRGNPGNPAFADFGKSGDADSQTSRISGSPVLYVAHDLCCSEDLCVMNKSAMSLFSPAVGTRD